MKNKSKRIIKTKTQYNSSVPFTVEKCSSLCLDKIHENENVFFSGWF